MICVHSKLKASCYPPKLQASVFNFTGDVGLVLKGVLRKVMVESGLGNAGLDGILPGTSPSLSVTRNHHLHWTWENSGGHTHTAGLSGVSVPIPGPQLWNGQASQPQESPQSPPPPPYLLDAPPDSLIPQRQAKADARGRAGRSAPSPAPLPVPLGSSCFRRQRTSDPCPRRPARESEFSFPAV